VCGEYWKLKTFDRFGFHLFHHDGQLYADAIPDVDWQATRKDMARRAKALGVPLRYVCIRDDQDVLTILASVPILPGVARPVELSAALERLECAIDSATLEPRPFSASRQWGPLDDDQDVERVSGGCSPSAFHATCTAWGVSSKGKGRFIRCEKPGLFFDADGQLDEQARGDFWYEGWLRDAQGDAAADKFHAAAVAQRKRIRVDPATCQHDYQDAPDPERPGWIRTDCVRCGQFYGRRPGGGP
jgi:hypothetical protein